MELSSEAAKQRHTLALFKESVILSLCGDYTSRKKSQSVHKPKASVPSQSIDVIAQHQIRPSLQIPDLQCRKAKCQLCMKSVRTACFCCKLAFCYSCGIQHQLSLAGVITDPGLEQEIPPHLHTTEENEQVISLEIYKAWGVGNA